MAKKVYNFQAEEATREGSLLRMSIQGPTGSGKSLLSLRLATRMRDAMNLGPVYVIDTEHKSAKAYAMSPRTGSGFAFKHVKMPPNDNSIDAYLAALDFCEGEGAGVIVVDSLSHAWAGIGGVLEAVDAITGNSRSKNAFSEGWRVMSGAQLRFIERIMNSPTHVIATLRAKTEWTMQQNERGKVEPTKVGLAPVQREGTEYEFTLAVSISAAPQHVLTVEKSRALDWPDLAPGLQYAKPAEEFCDLVIGWLSDAPIPQAEPKPAPDPFADPNVNNRAKAYRAAIDGSGSMAALDRVAERAKAEPHDKLRTDVMNWIAKRRTMFQPPTNGAPPPPSAPTNSAAPLSDEDRLKAIGPGRE